MTLHRRKLLQASAAGLLAGGYFSQLIADERSAKPKVDWGVASGDVRSRSAVVWSRTDRETRAIVEWSTRESFTDAKKVLAGNALEPTDFTSKVQLKNLPAGQRIFYRFVFEDLTSGRVKTVSPVGQFELPASEGEIKDVHFAWSGDTAGQGWGINPDFGGMLIYKAIAAAEPDFFIHSGDYIYADGPIPGEIPLDDGTVWKNLTTEAKSKVAETLDEFRGNYLYNLMDEHVRNFNAACPQYVQWDDHETTNNWYPGEVLPAGPYQVRDASLLAARAKRAFLDFTPTTESLAHPGLIYRNFQRGPLLDVFMIDMRTYRGPNTANRQTKRSAETTLLGGRQLAWLKQRLKASTATWKIIASDMPIGMVVGDGDNFEAVANGNGPALGRELEIAGLLRFLKAEGITGVVWLTADVHHAAAHFYDPSHAVFQDFSPFWEFVAGPLHAGTFGPNTMDNTFGPQVKFQSIPKGMKGNRPPSEGKQFFGQVKISAKTKAMTVSLHDITGKELFQVDLDPSV